MKPYVSQPVHFVAGSSEHLAAIVVSVWEGEAVNLAVFDNGRSYPTEIPVLTHQLVPHDEVKKAWGTWHFIEKELLQDDEPAEPADEHP